MTSVERHMGGRGGWRAGECGGGRGIKRPWRGWVHPDHGAPCAGSPGSSKRSSRRNATEIIKSDKTTT